MADIMILPDSKIPPTLKELDGETPHIDICNHYKQTISYSRSVGKDLNEEGVLYLMTDEREYSDITGEPHKPEKLVLPVLEIDAIADTSEKFEFRKFYEQAMSKYKLQQDSGREIICFLLQPIKLSASQMAKLKAPGDKRSITAIPVIETVKRFKDEFMIPKPGELEIEAKKIERRRFDPSGKEKIEDFMQKIVDRVDYCKEYDKQMPDFKVTNDLIVSIGGPTGKFENAIKTFEDRPEAEQTLAQLQKDVTAGLKRIKRKEAQHTGFSAAAAAAEAADALVLAQQQIADLKAQVALILPAAAAAAAAAPQHQPVKPPHGPPRVKGAGGGGGQGAPPAAPVDLNAPIVQLYCWSCGPNKEHNSDVCPHPEKGHIKQATAADPRGGRRRYCPVGLRLKFPHPV